jgi:fatty-acyl-CoA synthase
MLTHRDVLRRCASAYGPRTAITSEDGADLTYAELDLRTEALAEGLQALGLGPGDRLVWLDRNSADFLLMWFATAKLGMTFTALNSWLRPHELAPQVELVRPTVVVAGAEFVATAEAACVAAPPQHRFVRSGQAAGWGAFHEIAAGAGTPVAQAVSEDAVHEIVFTSGTTGQAKGVMRTQRARILDSLTAALAFQLTREDHLLAILPQFHIGGGSVPNQLLVQGGRVTVLRQYEPEAVARALGSGVTYFVGVPAHYSLLFESGHLHGVDTSAVRGCYVGGSVASPTTFEAIRKHFPHADLVHGYGSTESGPHTMALRGQAFLDHFGSLGLPVPGTEIRVVDASGAAVDDDEVGELLVRSDAVMLGYLDRPELTAQVLDADGWLRTGDLVRRSADGYCTLVDRAKDIVITGGENVYPREVEDVLSGYPGVAEVAVIGVPDPLYEERVVALVRPLPGAEEIDPSAVIRYARKHLAGFKTPKEVHVVADFPRTGTGKIAKAELRAQHGSVFGAAR